MVRRLAAPALAAIALISAVVAAPRTWAEMSDQRDRYAAMSDLEAESWAAEYHELDPGAFAFFARHLRRGERYYVHAPAGGEVGFFDEAGVVRTYAAFALLPRLQVSDASRADVVLGYHADPTRLAFDYCAIVRARRWAVARKCP